MDWTVVYIICSGAVGLRGVLAVLPMDKDTSHTIRGAAIFMAAGALGAALSPGYGYDPSWMDATTMAGVSVYVWRDRRRVIRWSTIKELRTALNDLRKE